MKLFTLRRAALCLALAGVLFRSLVPTGFMPTTGDASHAGALLMPCPHGEFPGPHDSPAGPHTPSGDHGVQLCPFGMAATPVLPGAAANLPVAVVTLLLPDTLTTHCASITLAGPPPARAPPALS